MMVGSRAILNVLRQAPAPSTTRFTPSKVGRAVRLERATPQTKSHQTVLTQTRTKHTASTGKDRRSTISRALKNNDTHTSDGSNKPAIDNLFGMRPIDYSILPPIVRSPPPPPAKPGLRKYLFPISLFFTLSVTGYFYLNNKNDNFEFWNAMQKGEALPSDEDEGDDDDEEEE